MAKQQGQPAPTKLANTNQGSEFMVKNRQLILETAAAYKAGGTTIEEVRQKWQSLLKKEGGWNFLRGHLGMIYITQDGFDARRLFSCVFDDRYAESLGRLAETMKRLATKCGGHRLTGFGYERPAEDLLADYYQKFGEVSPANGDLAAAFEQVDQMLDPDVMYLERWLESSRRRRSSGNDRAERGVKTQAAIEEALAEGEGEVTEPEPTVVDPRTKIRAAIVNAAGRKADAIASEDFVAASAAKEEIALLESELEALDAAPAVADPRVELNAKLEDARNRKAAAITSENYALAAALKGEITQLEAELAALNAQPTTAELEPAVSPIITAPVLVETEVTTNHMPTPPVVVIAAPAAPVPVADNFLGLVSASRLAKETKTALIARFVGGDEKGAVAAFATVSALKRK